MKKYFIAFFTLLLLLNSCSNVPLSYNTQITDVNILGYWQTDDTTTLVFNKNADGIVYFNQYEVSGAASGNPHYEKQYENDLKVFFTDIEKDNKIYHFVSIQGDDTTYGNYAFKTDEYNNMLFAQINENFSKKSDMDVEDFDSSAHFRKYVYKNMSKSAFYADRSVFRKKDGVSSFISLTRPEKVIDHSKENSLGLLLELLLKGNSKSESNSGEIRYKRCNRCYGTGYEDTSDGHKTCGACNGKGEVRDY